MGIQIGLLHSSDFAGSVFIAWVMSMALNAVVQYFVSKNRAKKLDKMAELAKIKEKKAQSFNPNLRITKLDKPIGEMNQAERKEAAESIHQVMMDQINKHGEDNK